MANTKQDAKADFSFEDVMQQAEAEVREEKFSGAVKEVKELMRQKVELEFCIKEVENRIEELKGQFETK